MPHDPRVSCSKKAELYCAKGGKFSYPNRCATCGHNINVWHYFGWLTEILDTTSPTIEEVEKYWDQYKPIKTLVHYG